MAGKQGKRQKGALTPKQERFIAEYLVDLNGTQAAIRAGYSPRTANEQAARLLAKDSVKSAVASREARIANRLEVTAERVLLELSRLAYVDPAGFYYPPEHPKAGRLMSIHEMDADHRACIAGFELARANLDATDGKRNEEWLHKIKQYDKTKALEMLGKHLALFKDVVEVTGDWDKLAARLASIRPELHQQAKIGRGAGAAHPAIAAPRPSSRAFLGPKRDDPRK